MNIGGVYLDKKTFILPIVGLLIICIACWYMFSGGIPDNGGSINQVRNEISTAREQLARANQQLSDSQAIVEDLRRTSVDLNQQITESRAAVDRLRQANRDLADQIERGSNLNSENLRLVRECQQEFRTVREAGKK